MSEARSSSGAVNRPLSPHLQIYRPLINMVMSILHRITGAALYFGSLLLAWWLTAAAVGPQYFAFVNGIFSSLPGKIVLFGFTWALLHHMMGGIRHFIWDTCHGLDIASVKFLSMISGVVSVAATVAIWTAVYLAR
ncbi:MAG: succinate dehydrogenase, cytochrome b556 subunit [Alphaproteobacteria bacterium]|nr:succinate dehydrogenase, cytochrome b556 subunit [Alphaproteobacteria bacterium]